MFWARDPFPVIDAVNSSEHQHLSMTARMQGQYTDVLFIRSALSYVV